MNDKQKLLVQSTDSTVATRFNLGSGPNAVDGWTNVDRSPSLVLSRVPLLRAGLHRVGLIGDSHMTDWPSSIVMHNLSKGVPCGDGEATAIYSSHMLEHLYFEDAQHLLNDCRRALKPGGVLRVALPDGEAIAKLAFTTDPDEAKQYNKSLNAHPLRRPGTKAKLRAPLKGGMHRWQPTRALVSGMLSDAGFDKVVECEFQQGDLPGVEHIEHRPVSIFFEAS